MLARTASSVVWKGVPHRSTDAYLEWRGCSTRSGRMVLLDESDTFAWTDVTRVRLSGRYAAYVRSRTDHYLSTIVSLEVVDLVGDVARRRVRLAFNGGFGGGQPLKLQVTGLGLTRDGALGWRAAVGQDALLFSPDEDDHSAHDSVGTLDSRGAAIVSTGAPGTIAGFELRHNSLTWTVSGSTQSATLQGRAPLGCGTEPCWRSDPALPG